MGLHDSLDRNVRLKERASKIKPGHWELTSLAVDTVVLVADTHNSTVCLGTCRYEVSEKRFHL